MLAQVCGVGEEAVGDVEGVAYEAGDRVVRGGAGFEEAEDEGRGLVGEGFDVVGLEEECGGGAGGWLRR
ncbi:hypothetical protein [Kitasatospora purpeofusca]|uniref:hypothetical protein n=1 Tax=Kitasatospora purpeofusca TaxID=67352 RepID=UPI002256E07B|nr:hypothetical protein [Kitasatospora purpeofusca]MCX4755762.1 hypothetical protein [Kitasatospora purpeofusca]WSR36379.1 hypothetical protein OG715_38765 [Kitasatospora purpeofusca]WSR44664.1 hypothetical protein OG196_39650 [Kitasatospora purpeofusca]